MRCAARLGLAVGLVLSISCSTQKSSDGDPSEARKSPPGESSSGESSSGEAAGGEAAGATGEKASPTPVKSELIARFEAIVNEVCACDEDDACIDAGTRKMAELMTGGQDVRRSLYATDRATMQQLTARYDRCIAKRGSSVVAETEAVVDRACACKDTTCLEAAQKELAALGRRYSERGADITAEQGDQLTKLGQRLAECGQKLTRGDGAASP